MKHSKTVSHSPTARVRSRGQNHKIPASKSSRRASPAIPDSLARHGKIARLPRKIREQLNRHLDEGYGGPQVLRWLNRLPETRRVLKEHFNGQPISQQNLSQWRQGGYRDWLLQQEASEALSDFAAGTHDVEQKMGLELANKLAVWLCMRYAVMTRQLERMDPFESFKSMRQMCRDVVALRRGDFKLREQKLKEARQQELTEEDHRKWVSRPGRLEQLLYEKTQDQKYLKQIKKEKDKKLDIIFGITPKEDYEEDDVAEAECPGSPSAPAVGAVQPGNSSSSKTRSASAKTKSHKVKQTKTKCDPSKCGVSSSEGGVNATEKSQKEQMPVEPVAAASGPAAAEPAAKGVGTAPSNGNAPSVPENKTVPDTAPSPGSETPGQTSKATAATAPATNGPANPTPTKPQEQAKVPTRPDTFATRCHCGAYGTVSAEECPRCYPRWSKNMPCCPCHQAVPGT